jgi:PAS domain S-box-containing protein
LVGLGLAVALILGASAIAHFTQRELLSAGRAVDHTRLVLYQIEQLHSLIKDTGVGLRSYLISGDEQFLETGSQAADALPGALARVRELTSDNPARQAQLDELQTLVERRLAWRSQLLDRGITEGERAFTPVALQSSLSTMESIRELIATMIDAETAIDRTRRNAAQHRADLAALSQPGFTMISLVIIGLLFFQMYREVQLRRAAETQLRGFATSLEERVHERTRQLESSERRYRNVVNLIQEAIWIHAEGWISFVNAAAVKLFGARSADELVGRSIFSLLHPEDREQAQARTRIAVGSRQQLPVIDVRVVGLDGKTRIGAIQAISFVQDGQAQIMGSARDVTAQREVETQLRQAQKMESVGQLTGGVAHDFNNLLTVIIGRLDALVDRIPDEFRPAIESALTAADRGADLVRQMLAFSRRQVLAPGPIDLNKLTLGMEDLLRRTLGEDVEFEVKLGGDLRLALADRGQVENALLNLALNARDAMPNGGKLTIETDNKQLDADYAAHNAEVTPGDYVMLAVTDTGTGMTPEVIERAFEPFFTTKGVGRGSGLGLSMIYGFAKQSGGHLKIYSELGHGTTVRLYLPRDTGSPEATSEAPAETVENPRGGESILVVEDDELVRGFAVSQLRDLGYRVLEATDAREARAILAGNDKIDLLFTDVVMPGGMTGRQLGDLAKQTRPELKVLYTSGYTENSIVHQGKLDPGVIFLSKPFRRNDLARKIREALDTKQG